MGVQYIHRQTMANAMRYATPELSELESKIAQAAERALALELEIFTGLCARVLQDAAALTRAARALAELDVAAALAELATQRGDRERAVEGKGVAVRVDSGGGSDNQKK